MVVGQLMGQLEDLRSESSHNRSEVSEVARANERLRGRCPNCHKRSRRWDGRVSGFQLRTKHCNKTSWRFPNAA
jgi:predicted SprT family Zn-dependent metalloprotease